MLSDIKINYNPQMDKQITTPQSSTSLLAPAVKALVETIHIEIECGKERAYQAMEQEKKLTYWNVGKHIKQHLLQNEGRADYGKTLFPQISKELNISKSVLYDCVQFYEEYPKIFPTKGKLTWSHIRVLLHVPEKKARKEFEEKIVSEKLTVVELRKLVKWDNSVPPQTSAPILKVERGEPYIYRLKKIQNQNMIDLGFRFYIQNPLAVTKGKIPKNYLVDGEAVVRCEKLNKNYSFAPAGKEQVPHYTYKAYVLEIIDGDTLWVNIDLGFDSWTTQKLRLKGINTKAIETAEGQSAKKYMQSRLKGCEFIVVKTYWRDKFSRYLADIYYKKGEVDLYKLAQEGRFLNQELLNRELAVKY